MAGRKITLYQFINLYRKIKGDNIFTGSALTGLGHVLITKPDGTVENIVTEDEAGEGVEVFEGIICPGFVNAHCHIELSHLKNKIPKHTGLVNFVLQVMGERNVSDDLKQDAMRLAENELYNSGTVAVGDICNTTDSLLLKKSSKLYWHNFIEISGFIDAGAQKRFSEAEEIKKSFEWLYAKDSVQHRGDVSFSPHAPYSVSQKLFSMINEATEGKIISIHNQEAAAEDELYRIKNGDFLSLYKKLGIEISSFSATGKSSLQTWLPYFTQDQQIISVHNSFTNEADLHFAQNTINNNKIYYCLCPNANLYIENVLPPANILLQNNCNIILGTDSYASNGQLSIFEEIKTIRTYFPHIGLHTVLKWATINGAQALGIDNVYGSFETGKCPGVTALTDKIVTRII